MPIQLQPFTQAFSLLSFAVSVLALVVALKNYRRKAGVLVRGTITTSSTIDSQDHHISEVLLENAKDRAVTILAIYLRIGANIYLELEDFESKPLVLGPYETYHKHYGPVEFYSLSAFKVKIQRLLDDPSIKKQLILSTSHGRHTVRARIPRWNPVTEFFSNYFTSIVRPVRSTYKGEDLGSNIKYVVEISAQDGREEIIPLRHGDHVFQIFRDFSLTEASLSSAKALEEFLNGQVLQGRLVCKHFTVLDLDGWRARAHKSYLTGAPRDLQACGTIWYHVVGRLYTKYSSWKTQRENRLRVGS